MENDFQTDRKQVAEMLKLHRAQAIVAQVVVAQVATQIAKHPHLVIRNVGAHPAQTRCIVHTATSTDDHRTERTIVQIIAHGRLVHRPNRTPPISHFVQSIETQMHFFRIQ